MKKTYNKITTLLLLLCFFLLILLNLLLINSINYKFNINCDFKLIIILFLFLLFCYIFFLNKFNLIFKIKNKINFILQFHLIFLIFLYFILYFFLYYINSHLDINIYQNLFFKINIIRNYWTDSELYDISYSFFETNNIQISKEILLKYIAVFKNPQDLLINFINPNISGDENNLFSLFIFPLILGCILFTHISYFDINFLGELLFQVPIATIPKPIYYTHDVFRNLFFGSALQGRSFCLPTYSTIYPPVSAAILESQYGVVFSNEEALYYTKLFNKWSELRYQLSLRMLQYQNVIHYLHYFHIDKAFGLLKEYGDVYGVGIDKRDPDWIRKHFLFDVKAIWKKYSY